MLIWNQWSTIFDPVMVADPLHAVTGMPWTAGSIVDCPLIQLFPGHVTIRLRFACYARLRALLTVMQDACS